MAVPVIIAARNESAHIGHALHALSRQDVEPIVVVNGCTDNTPDIANAVGATVLESAEGKMPAIQQGLRHLGNRALEPVLIMDSDSHPLTKKWSERMSRSLHELPPNAPAMTWGPYVFNGEINPALGALFTITSMRVSWQDRNKDLPRTIRGGNTGLFMKDAELLENMLSLENYWPREDVAIFDTMRGHGATSKVTLHPEAWMITSGYRTTDTIKKIIKDHKHPSKVMDESYKHDAPAGSQPYFSETTDTVKHDKP